MNLLEEGKFTRFPKKDSLIKVHSSTLMDHVAQTIHTINWDSVNLPMKQDDWITQAIMGVHLHKEAGGPRNEL